MVGGTVLLLGALALAVFLGRPGVQPPSPVAPPPPAAAADPEGRPERETDARLAEAEVLLEGGDLARAQEVLASIPATDVIAFSSEERASYHAMIEEVQGVSRQQAVEQLRSAFAAGNLTRLRGAVNALSGLDRSELAAEGRDVPELLVQSRRAIQLHSRLQESVRAGDHAAVLERAAEFLAVLPRHGGAQNQREQAARALEERSREEERAGRYESAAEFLRVIQRRWPERAGLEAGIARVLQLHEAVQRGRRSLDAALLTLEQGRPDEGLRMLGDAPPHPSQQQEFRDARQQLQARLAELDAQPPAVTLVDESDLRFRRNEAAVIRLRIVDDYRVEGVQAWVRNETNPQYREIPVRHGGGNQYRIDVPVQLHGNQPVEFYVEARDISGNTGTLGSPEQPVQMRRRGFLGR